MQNLKVSIVIPVYQPTFFLTLALESIRKQTFRNFEIIISDDTPNPEKSKEILADFTDLDIKYVKNNGDRGIFNNLNNAIKNITGELIQIFCQDDLMMENFLEIQLQVFQNYPSAGLAFSKFTEIDNEGKVLPLHSYKEQAIKSWQAFIGKQKATNYLFAFGCFPGNLSPVMFKREVLEKTGSFNQEFSFSGDYEYWIRVAKNFDFAFNNQPSLFIRTHDNRASSTIGFWRLIPDSTHLYRVLYEINTIKGKKFKKYLQVNNLVTGYFKGAVKGILSGDLKYFRLLKYFQKHPFHLPTIFLIILHRFITGKVSWFVSEKDC